MASCTASYAVLLCLVTLSEASCIGAKECIETVRNGTQPVQKQGYTRQPDARGTLDILWSCIFTLFLCSWTIICTNLPGVGTSYVVTWWRKSWLTLLGLLAPEFVFGAAFIQWSTARTSMKQFQESGYKDWTMTHSFFADAGGFLLHTRDFPACPINGLQLHYLVIHGYVPLPALTKQHIGDRNKMDGMLRLISLWQVFWFCFNEFFRFLDGIHITALELTTVANIICSVPSAMCWFDKPQDVTMPETIFCKTTMAQILKEAKFGNPTSHYRYSPLEFIDRREWSWSRQWCHWTNILRHMGIDFVPDATPIKRVQTTYIREISDIQYFFVCAVGFVYMAMFVLAWNHDFPTRLEQLHWRFASLGAMATLLLCLFFERLGFILWPVWRERLMCHRTYRKWRAKMDWHPQRPWEKRLNTKVSNLARMCRNNTVSQDRALDVPLKTQLPLYFIGFMYFYTRGTMAILDIIELRHMPISAYTEARWTSLLPHM
ncbi:hypothetical protein BDZ85DRAFT_248631 [Elsinoe ampelina]|uniref:Uncharacterized protein n=1 Tax=Elsinoe ampelina TaxID=302913 RepID=A0A6A6GI04_9PEZI|nr:hypothetical protein BDZ85DRAFT_248631 [Elsinoe ampelina]